MEQGWCSGDCLQISIQGLVLDTDTASGSSNSISAVP